MSRLLQRVEASILRRELLRPGQKVLVAVSGGVDSMVLLRLLHRLSGKFSWRLHVAHLNHQLRGRSSDADERLVVREARKLKLPVIVERVSIRRLAKDNGISLEMAAREARHEFLARRALRLRAPTIALAHHADDQLELFFLRLFRGSGIEGLAGMRWKSRSPSRRTVELVRPLLDFTKPELKAQAKEEGIPYREDASNASLDIRRNRIRHELLPLLRRRYQPGLDRTVARLMEMARSDSDCLNAAAERFLASKGRGFRRLPVAVQRRCIQLQLQRASIQPEFDLVERLRTGGGVFMAAGARAISLDPLGKLQARTGAAASSSAGAAAMSETIVQLDGKIRSARYGGLEFRWRIGRNGGGIPSKKGTRSEFFDADRVGSTIILRYWRPGDRMQPIGMSKGVKLQDLFTNVKIPRDERHKLVILTTTRGEIVWVQGLRISERFKLSGGTNRRLHWQWKPL